MQLKMLKLLHSFFGYNLAELLLIFKTHFLYSPYSSDMVIAEFVSSPIETQHTPPLNWQKRMFQRFGVDQTI